MGDRQWAGKTHRFVTSHSGQLSLLPSAGLKMSTGEKCGDALRLESKGRVWFMPLVDKRVGGL